MDLLTEILVRVPAKSLFKFKSVSKQWLPLISDSQFSRNHSTHQNPHPLPSGLYFYSERDRSLSLNDRITHVSVNGHPRTSLPSFSFLDGLGSKTELLHSSNGLMLCSTTGEKKSEDFVVCNLTTQKFVVLPTLALVSKSYMFLRPSSKGTRTYGPLWNGAIILMSCVGAWRNCAEHDHFYFRFDIDAEKLTTTQSATLRYQSSKELMYFGECGGRLLRIQTQHNATDFKVLEMMDGEDSFRWAVN